MLTAATAAGPARAWVPETRVRLADEAARLMPDALRIALEAHRGQLLRGMLAPMTGEDGPEHQPSWAGGEMERRLADEAEALIQALGEPTPFSELATRFGSLAHYVADAGFPPGASQADGAARYAHFAGFCESRRERFPVVFYGHADPDLEHFDWRGFGSRVLLRASEDDRELARAYALAGDPPNPAAFDDRSIPFAVGSLAYSRTINDIARAWLAAWRQAGGDLGRTPYAGDTTGTKSRNP